MIHVATQAVGFDQVAVALEREGFMRAYDSSATGTSKSVDWLRGPDRVAFSSDLASGLAFFVTWGPEQEALGALVRRVVPCAGVEEQITADLEAPAGAGQVRALFRLAELARYASLDSAISVPQISDGLARGLKSSEPFVYGAALELALNLMWPELEPGVLALAERAPELEWVGEYWRRIRAETEAAEVKQRSKAEREALRASLTSLVEEQRWDEALSAAERVLQEDTPPKAAFRALALALKGLGRSWEAAFWTAVWFGKAEEDAASEALSTLCRELPQQVPPLAPMLRQAWARISEHEPLSRGLEALREHMGDRPCASELEAFLAALAVHKSYDRPTQALALPRLVKLLDRFPGAVELWLMAALAHAASDDLPGAEVAYRRALETVGERPSPEEEGVSAAASAMRDDPDPPTEASIRASLRWLYRSRSQHEDLFRVANEQLDAAGEPDPLVLRDRGLAATFTQRHEQAILDYRAALTGGYPDTNGACHYNLACELARQGQKAEALDALSVAIERDQGFAEKARADDYFTTLWEDKDFRALVSGLTETPELQDVERAISHSLGYHMRGDGDAAVERGEYAVAAAELIGDQALLVRALRQLGQALSFHVSPARGLVLLERAVRLAELAFPEDPIERARGLHSLGQCQHAAQHFEAAQQSYQSALELRRAARGDVDFEVAITYGDLARVASDRGDTAEAQAYHEQTSRTLRAVLETQQGDDRLDTLLNLALHEGNRAADALSSERPAEEVVKHAEAAAGFHEDLLAGGGHVPASALVRLRRVVGAALGDEPTLVERGLGVAQRLFVLEYPDPRVREHKLYWNGLRQAAFELLNSGAVETEIAGAIARVVRGDEPGEPIARHPSFANLGVEFSRRLTGATDLVMVAMSLDMATRGAQTVDEMLDNLEAFALSNLER